MSLMAAAAPGPSAIVLHLCCCVASVFARDHDIEGMSDGFDPPTAYGQIEGYEDKSMGWAR
jgi:hypothetical protein